MLVLEKVEGYPTYSCRPAPADFGSIKSRWLPYLIAVNLVQHSGSRILTYLIAVNLVHQTLVLEKVEGYPTL